MNKPPAAHTLQGKLRISPYVLLLAVFAFEPLRADSANAKDVSLHLQFASGASTFDAGDPIRIELVFTARKKGLSLNATTTNPPSPVDEISLTPLSGAFNWLEDQAQGHRYSPDYAAITSLDPGKPVTVTLTLNDIYRFDLPGRHLVRVISHRLSGGMHDLARIFPAVISNELAFDIRSTDPKAESVKAAKLEWQIYAAPDLQSAQALAGRLDYMADDVAIEAKLSLFLHPKTFYPFAVDVSKGLWIARNREMIVSRLEQALDDPTQTLDIGTNLFQTAVALAASLDISRSSASEKELEATLSHRVATSLRQRTGKSRITAALTVFLSLVRLKKTTSPGFQTAREILITHFEDVDQYNVDWLLNGYGKYLDDPRLLPILTRMLETPNVARSVIVHYLSEHQE